MNKRLENLGKLDVRTEVLRWLARAQPSWPINENPSHSWFDSLAPNLRLQNFEIGLLVGSRRQVAARSSVCSHQMRGVWSVFVT